MNLKQQIVHGVFWTSVSKILYILIGFVGNIFLARLISPEDFGRVGIVLGFVVIANVIAESGFSGALVRKLNASDDDLFTAFFFNLIVSTGLYLLFFIFSNYISWYFKDSSLVNIIRILGIVVVLNSLSMVQIAKANIALEFKKTSIISLITIIISTSFGVIFAYIYRTVWALVYMQIVSSAILTILYWLYFGPVRIAKLNKESFNYLFKFGLNTTLALFLNRIFDNVYQFIIGKFISIGEVGFFYQGKKMQDIPLGFIRSVTSGVVFSSLSKLQNNNQGFYKYYSKIITILAVSTSIICVLIYVYSDLIVKFLYGEKWLHSVFYIRFLIVASFFYVLETYNRMIFKIFNETQKILYLEIIKKSFQIVTIIIGLITFSIKLLLVGYVLTNVFSYLLNIYEAKKIVKLMTWNEVKNNFFIVFILTVLMSTLYLINRITLSSIYFIYCLTPIVILFFLIIIKKMKIFNLVEEFINLKESLAFSKLNK